MWVYSIIFIVALGFTTNQETKMTTAEIASFKQLVQNQAKSISSIQTDFTQKKSMAFLENDVISKGRMLLNAEGNLKWQYTEPNKYSIIFKNDRIYINDNGNKSTPSVDQRLFKKISALISSSIKGDVFNDAEFSYEYFKKGTDILVKMSSKDKTLAKYIQKIELIFPKNEALVSQVKLIEPSGDFTIISFTNRKLNAVIDKKEFEH
jgi:outer membrane lipoprotein carrier protein